MMQIRQRETLSHQGAITHEVCYCTAQYDPNVSMSQKNLYGSKIWHHLWTFPCKTVEGEKESMHFRPSLFAASKPLVLSFQARNWQYSTTCCQLKIGSYMNLCEKKKVPTRNISLEGDFKRASLLQNYYRNRGRLKVLNDSKLIL